MGVVMLRVSLPVPRSRCPSAYMGSGARSVAMKVTVQVNPPPWEGLW